MGMTARVLFSAGILVVDSILFFIPLSAFFLAYIILFNPQWFQKFLVDMDRND